MGMGNIDVALIQALRIKGYIPDRASVVEIGAQQFSAHVLRDPAATNAIAAAFGVAPRNFGDAKLSYVKHSALEALDPQAPPTREFWRSLGMTYAAIDLDGSPGSIALDLNYDSAPAEMVGKFDIVTNFGTTEHVANQLNAFKMIHELCRPGGVIVHNLPAQGMMHHGFFNYNPKFFWMLARSCNYKVLDLDMSMEASSSPLPDDVVEEVTHFRPDFAERAKGFSQRHSGILAAFHKWLDIPFVAPLDVPTGAGVNNEALKERYWTVFDQGRLHAAVERSEGRRFAARALRRLRRLAARALGG